MDEYTKLPEEQIPAESLAAQDELMQQPDAQPKPESDAAECAPQPVMATVTVADIRFRNNEKTYYFDPGELTLRAGDHVVMDTSRGVEFGYCTCGNHEVPASEIVPPLRKVLRIATAQDERVNSDNQEKEKRAYDVCLQKIYDHKLEMQLVSAECAFDGSKILFFFTADGRVDFRELVKDLASVFRTRIELRQIGVRDKAKMVGGLGVCGRPFCCKQFLDDFQPVSIKMAKTQSLSLNPTKISGVCGRLMCCLKYEQDAYEDLLRTAPKNESFVDTPDGRGTVTEVNLLRQSVKVRMEDHPENIGCYKNCDICVLRSGKARKNDPPIPKDLAPISSRPKPAQDKEKEVEELPELIFSGAFADQSWIEPQPVREEASESAENVEARADAQRSRSRRRRGGKGRGQKPSDGAQKPASEQKPAQPKEQKSKESRPQTPKQPRAEKPQPQEQSPDGAPAASSEGAKQAGGNNRRRRYRSRRPNGGHGSNNGGNAAPNT